jgi:hypothetical protein
MVMAGLERETPSIEDAVRELYAIGRIKTIHISTPANRVKK